MKVNKIRKRGRLFIILLSCTISFIVVSLILIFKTHKTRNFVVDRVHGITTATEVDFNAFSLYSSFDQLEYDKLLSRIKSLAAKELPIQSNPEFEPLQKSFSELKSQISGLSPDKVLIKYSLLKIHQQSQQVIIDNRDKVSLASVKLSTYWMYTYILMAVACILSILLSLSAYFTITSGKQLAKLSRQNRLLLNNSIDCIIVCDIDGTILEFNKEAERVFGYKVSEIRKKDARILYFHEDGMEIVNQVLSERGKFSGEILNKNKDGKPFTSFLSASLLYDENRKIVGSMGISRDITQQKKMEDEFRHIINNASDIIYTADLNGNFVYINPTVEGILGYCSEELVGKSYLSLIHPDHIEQVKAYYTDYFKNRKNESFYEFQVSKKDGSALWVGQTIRTAFSQVDNKTITGFYGIVRNRNERKVVELKLMESEKQYRDLFDNSSDLIQSIDPEGNFLYVNKAWQETVGYSDEEIKHLNMWDIIHPESREHSKNIYQGLMEAHDTCEIRLRFSILTKSGEKRTFSSSMNAKIENDKVVSIQSFIRDITTQEETQRLLKKSEVNFRQIAETIKDTFYLYNILEKKYEYISPNCIDVIGADQQFFYSGKSHTAMFVHPDDQAKLREANVIVDAGKSYEIDYRVIINDKISWLNEKSFPIIDQSGVVTSNSGVVRDITNIKAAQQTIHRQSIEIGKSINYAKSIQDSSLPTNNEIASIFPESFVFYSPKDILSGDFYIFDTVKWKPDEELTVFLVADCTGHGVPGGILSLLCNSLTRESFTHTNLSRPSEALDFIRDKIIKFFRSSHTKRMQDGMDIAFCVLNSERTKLYFSGANSSVVIISDNELTEYKGDKQHIGYSVNPKPFNNQVIDIKEGDCIYLFTDGYPDQFSEKTDKKFSKKRLKSFLQTVYTEPMRLQNSKLQYEFFEWRGRNEQTDDVTLLGIKI